MTDLVPIRQFLGLEIECNHEKQILYVYQSRYIYNVLTTFGLSDVMATGLLSQQAIDFDDSVIPSALVTPQEIQLV